MKTTPEIDRKVYELAKGYLPSINKIGVTHALIEKYLNPLSLNPKPTSKEELYKRLLQSAQNAHMKATVIGESIRGVDKLGPILDDFKPGKVLDKYGDDWQAVLDRIVRDLKPTGKIRRTPRSIWPLYCQTILSAAAFIDQFDSANHFFEWVDFFDRDAKARPSLPMLLDHEIEGFGFALSCDFLKELGYVNFSKPDVHLNDISKALELCPAKADDYQLFKAIIRVAGNASVTPYAVDKVFWLIGSGNFYADPSIGSIGSHKQEFIDFAQAKLLEGK